MIDLEAVKEIYKLEDLIKVVIETDCLDTPEVHNYETDHDIIKQSEVSDAWAALRLKDKIKPLLDSLISQLAEANKEISRLQQKYDLQNETLFQTDVSNLELSKKYETLTEQHAKAVECLKYVEDKVWFDNTGKDSACMWCDMGDSGEPRAWDGHDKACPAHAVKACLKELGVKDE